MSVSGTFFRTICNRLNRSLSKHLVCACRSDRLSLRDYSTHYETLGISKNARSSEIKEAYIEKTKAYHPDVVNSDNGDEFLKIAEAYEVLSNPKTRHQYDFKEFGMSSEYNRFKTGEYNIPLYDSPERKMRYERMKNRKTEGQSEQSHGPMKMTLTATERKILDYLLGSLVSICIAMYLISRYQRQHADDKCMPEDSEEKDK